MESRNLQGQIRPMMKIINDDKYGITGKKRKLQKGDEDVKVRSWYVSREREWVEMEKGRRKNRDTTISTPLATRFIVMQTSHRRPLKHSAHWISMGTVGQPHPGLGLFGGEIWNVAIASGSTSGKLVVVRPGKGKEAKVTRRG